MFQQPTIPYKTLHIPQVTMFDGVFLRSHICETKVIHLSTENPHFSSQQPFNYGSTAKIANQPLAASTRKHLSTSNPNSTGNSGNLSQAAESNADRVRYNFGQQPATMGQIACTFSHHNCKGQVGPCSKRDLSTNLEPIPSGPYMFDSEIFNLNDELCSTFNGNWSSDNQCIINITQELCETFGGIWNETFGGSSGVDKHGHERGAISALSAAVSAVFCKAIHGTWDAANSNSGWDNLQTRDAGVVLRSVDAGEGAVQHGGMETLGIEAPAVSTVHAIVMPVTFSCDSKDLENAMPSEGFDEKSVHEAKNDCDGKFEGPYMFDGKVYQTLMNLNLDTLDRRELSPPTNPNAPRVSFASITKLTGIEVATWSLMILVVALSVRAMGAKKKRSVKEVGTMEQDGEKSFGKDEMST
ncbi:hypothetical protein K458DRAFT_387315 [Lentithecium fluviatile CBS 122367]|uniref:Uncharacterized protein n=1 Tax=Lentithecium fluviatile CBS 122367 TaxID=1168545 RepID=A0A6G1J7C7_9PLEO|nr:hypothetical protein K458DRAFT_387315 [Lentithecium fluviatile CBS 122367]